MNLCRHRYFCTDFTPCLAAVIPPSALPKTCPFSPTSAAPVIASKRNKGPTVMGEGGGRIVIVIGRRRGEQLKREEKRGVGKEGHQVPPARPNWRLI